MGHTAVSAIQASSVTLYIWQHGAKESYNIFSTFSRLVDTKTNIIKMVPNLLNVGENMNLNR